MPASEDSESAPALSSGVRQAILVAGICTMVLGVVLAVWPNKTIVVVELLFGLALLLSGALQVLVALGARFALVWRVLVLCSGLLSVVLAVFCARGGNSVLLLELWVGLGWAIRGITQATVAVWVDDLVEPGKQELFGLLTLAAGIGVILWEMDSLVTVGLVTGLCLIALGAMEMLTVATVRADGIHLPGTVHIPWRTSSAPH